MQSRIIGFLTDLGLVDDAVGICKGLMLQIHPDAVIVDICHAVTPFDIREGSAYLADVPRYFPPGVTVACVVFPETGTGLRSIALKNRKGQVFVAPNNGLLTRVIETSGIETCWEVTNHDVWQPEALHNFSFHGRDIIASAAAHIAAGFPLDRLGPSVQPSDIARLDLGRPEAIDGRIVGQVSIIDKNFGNVWTNIPVAFLTDHGLHLRQGAEVELALGELPLDARGITSAFRPSLTLRVPFLSTFGAADPGKPLLYVNSRGHLAIALNKGSFATHYNIVSGMAVKLTSRTEPAQ